MGGRLWTVDTEIRWTDVDENMAHLIYAVHENVSTRQRAKTTEDGSILTIGRRKKIAIVYWGKSFITIDTLERDAISIWKNTTLIQAIARCILSMDHKPVVIGGGCGICMEQTIFSVGKIERFHTGHAKKIMEAEEVIRWRFFVRARLNTNNDCLRDMVAHGQGEKE